MKKMRRGKTVAVVSALCIAVGLTGCGGGNQNAVETSALKKVSFPVKEEVTMTIWKYNSNQVLTTEADMGAYQELAKDSGVKIEMMHPVAGQEAEQFNLMVASHEMPDIVYCFDGIYPGGLIKGYNDNLIYDLNELMEQNGDNLNALFAAFPKLKTEASDEEGHILSAPMIRGDSVVRTYRGPVVRKDYLDKFGLDIPQTIDDWHEMLTTFKNNGVEIPFTTRAEFMNTEAFIGAYGIKWDFMLDNGKVIYGPADARVKDYIKTMAQWYKEGLLDSEIATNDRKNMDSKILSLGAGSWVSTVGDGMGNYLSSAEGSIDGFDIVGVPYPGLTKDQSGIIIQRDPMVQSGLGASITTSTKHPDIAMALVDYAYGKKGHMLFNFGVEGVSYEMKDGVPVYTDEVVHNPDGLPMSKAGSKYALAFTFGPFVQDKYYGQQFYGRPQQQAAGKTWSKDVDKYAEKNIVLRGTPTSEESAEIAPMLNEVTTFVNEQYVKWLMGVGDVDAEFDSYIATLNSMGLPRIIEVYQSAHDRFIQKFPEMATQDDYNVSEFYWKDGMK